MKYVNTHSKAANIGYFVKPGLFAICAVLLVSLVFCCVPKAQALSDSGQGNNEVVAKIGDLEYTSINDALTYVNTIASDEEVNLEILQNVSEALTANYVINKNLVISSAGPLTIDFVDYNNSKGIQPGDGKTLTVGENLSLTNLSAIGPNGTSGKLSVYGKVDVKILNVIGNYGSENTAYLDVFGTINATEYNNYGFTSFDGGTLSATTAVNAGVFTATGNGKLSSTSWKGDIVLKDANLTTDGFTQNSTSADSASRLVVLGECSLNGFSLDSVRVGYETETTEDATLDLCGDSSINMLYLGQDTADWTGRTYKLNCYDNVTLSGQVYVRQNGQLNIDNGANVTSGYSCIYGQINVTNKSTYKVQAANFYVAGRVSDDKMAKDKAIITVDDSVLDFTKTFGLEISNGISSNPYKGSGMLVLKNGAQANGSAIWMGNNEDGSLGNIEIDCTDSTINLTGKKSFASLSVGNGDNVVLKNSTINAYDVSNKGTILVDRSDATADMEIISASSNADYGTRGVNYKYVDGTSKNFVLTVEGNSLWSKKFNAVAKNITTEKEYDDLHLALEECGASETVALLKDVTLTGNWTPIASFAGIFDGSKLDGTSYTIRGLNIVDQGAGGLGLIAMIDGGQVKNLNFESPKITSDIDGKTNYGVVAGHSYLNSETIPAISNIYVNGAEINTIGKYVGGIVGFSDANLFGCTMQNSKIVGKDQVGGLVGYVRCGRVDDNKLTSVNVEATAERAGGIVGKLQCAVDNDIFFSVNNNNIKQCSAKAPDMAGGIIGQLLGDMPDYEIKNNSIDVSLTAEKISPIGVLKSGQDTKFTSVLAAKITNDLWSKKTYSTFSYTYPAAETGAGDQVINNTPSYLTIEGSTANSKMYDGTKKADITLGNVSGIAEGDDVVVTATGEFSSVDVAEGIDVPVSYTLSGKDAGWYVAPAAQTLKADITKRSVTMKSGSAAKSYDGKPLTNTADPVVSGDGFVQGQGATYEVTGSQTEVGSSDNVFTYTLTSVTSEGNYQITKEFGTLTVNEAEPFIVTFDSQGGSAVAKQFVIPGSFATEPEPPTKENNIFKGWYDAVSGGNLYDFANTPVTKSFTLFAQWKEIVQGVDIIVPKDSDIAVDKDVMVDVYVQAFEHYGLDAKNPDDTLQIKLECSKTSVSQDDYKILKENVASGKSISAIDIKLIAVVRGQEKDYGKDNTVLIPITFMTDLSKKTNLQGCRVHDAKYATLPVGDEKMDFNVVENIINLNAKQFSTYAYSYNVPDPGDDPQPKVDPSNTGTNTGSNTGTKTFDTTLIVIGSLVFLVACVCFVMYIVRRKKN